MVFYSMTGHICICLFPPLIPYSLVYPCVDPIDNLTSSNREPIPATEFHQEKRLDLIVPRSLVIKRTSWTGMWLPNSNLAQTRICSQAPSCGKIPGSFVYVFVAKKLYQLVCAFWLIQTNLFLVGQRFKRSRNSYLRYVFRIVWPRWVSGW